MPGDLLVTGAAGEQLGDLALARGQAVQRQSQRFQFGGSGRGERDRDGSRVRAVGARGAPWTVSHLPEISRTLA